MVSFTRGGITMAQQAAQTRTSRTEMPQFTGAFSSFSVKDLGKAKEFYSDTLGLDVDGSEEGLQLDISGHSVFIYPKSNHEPATFTVLNLMVEDIASAVKGLRSAGIEFESYSGKMQTDENGIMWGEQHENGGPNIAWFRDPDGNFVSVIEE
jgi:catechol 2,3-dioxygenase-like lactoylglutathione lyase family enzyme